MSIRMLSRCSLVLAIGTVSAGCSFGGHKPGERTSECTWSRSSCMYEGSYEPDEAAYAEEEARRLNKASTVRLRSSSRK